jgi:hypothetical protein
MRTASTETRVELRFAQEYFYFEVNWLIGSWPVPCLFIVAKVRYMYSSCTNHEISGTTEICFTVLVLMQASLSLCRMEVHASFLWLARDSCDHLQDSARKSFDAFLELGIRYAATTQGYSRCISWLSKRFAKQSSGPAVCGLASVRHQSNSFITGKYRFELLRMSIRVSRLIKRLIVLLMCF